MNRQIKFRAKRKDNGQWVECESLIQGVIDGRKFVQLEHTDSNEFRQYEVIPETVGQFTGMEDKSGKEIFEGDILRVRHQKHAEPDLYLTQEVYYNDGCFCLRVNHELRPIQESLGNVPMFWINHPSFFEILGNIFDNPKLLKSCS